MVLLWFTTQQQESGQNIYEQENLQNQIEALTASVEKALLHT
jgi:hypothetical protein